MDKSVYNMKAEKIQRLVKQGDYETAAKICNTIDWSMVRSVRMLSLVSSVYEHVQQYDTAIDILLMAYEEAPAGRRYLYKLTELSLACGKIRDAENYYRSYLQEASDDNSRYILRYKIAEAKGESLDKRITILEAYKRTEFDEEWSYRLALLYAKARQPQKCVALCDEIILWFGVGPYVDKAIDLKAKFVPQSEPVEDYRVRREQRPQPVKPAPVPEKKREPELELSGEEAAEAAIARILPGGPEEEAPAPQPEAPQEKALPEHPEELPKIIINGAKGEPYVKFADEGAFFPEETEEETQSEAEQDDVKIYRPTRRVDAQPQQSGKSVPPTQRISIEDIRARVFNNETPARWQRPAQQPEGEYDQMELDFDSEVPGRVPHILFAAAETPAEGLKAAVEQLAAAHQAEKTAVGKVTRISASKLNEKGLIHSLPGIEGKDLIILGANSLEEELLGELVRASEHMDRRKFFVLADSGMGIDRLKARMGMGAPAQTAKPEQPAPEAPAAEEAVQEAPAFAVQEAAEPEPVPAAPEAPAPARTEAAPQQAADEAPQPAVLSETGRLPEVYEDPAQINEEAALPVDPSAAEETNALEVTAPLDEDAALNEPEAEDDLTAYEKPVAQEALQTADLPVMEEPVLEDATLQAALETPVGRGAEDRIVYGEQLTLPGTDMPVEKETLPAGFEETAAPATEEDNPFARDAAPAEPGKVTLEALTSHGLEELKEEFPDADLDLDDIFKQGE